MDSKATRKCIRLFLLSCH